MAQENGQPTGRALVVGLVMVALVGSALGAVVVRSDLLTGRSPAAAAPARDCGAVPAAEPDPAPFTPGRALETVSGFVPRPQVPDLGDAFMSGHHEYATPEAHGRSTPLLLPSTVTEAMVANGLRAAQAVGFEAGTTVFGLEAFRLASPEAAASYARTVLLAECEHGVAGSLRPLPGVAGGVMFAYHHDRRPPLRASFVVGDTAVRANLCICRKIEGDPFEVLESWAREVAFLMRGTVG
ncbi:MAG: hypothetical protein AB1673_12410 [Actinomycetota bacterium]